MLHRLAFQGVPAMSASPPWTSRQRLYALRCGAHPSATHHFRTFLHEDLLDMVAKGYWAILPYNAVRHLPHLKLSPSGVVPQREHRPRPIMDYTYTKVNQASLPLADL
jgi:hypothetical protein